MQAYYSCLYARKQSTCTSGKFSPAGPWRYWHSFGPCWRLVQVDRQFHCFPFQASGERHLIFGLQISLVNGSKERVRKGQGKRPLPNLHLPWIPWVSLCKLSNKEGRECCCMVWHDNRHPIQCLWLMGSPWGLPFLPPLHPLPLPLVVRVNIGEEEGRHSGSPGLLCNLGCRYGALITDKNPLKCTLKVPCGSSKCICYGQFKSLQVPEALRQDDSGCLGQPRVHLLG